MRKRFLFCLTPILFLTGCKISGNSTVSYAYETCSESKDCSVDITLIKEKDNNSYTSSYSYQIKDDNIHYTSNSNYSDGTSEEKDIYRINGKHYSKTSDSYSEIITSELANITTLSSVLSKYFVTLTSIQYDMTYNEEIAMYKLDAPHEYSNTASIKDVIEDMYVKIDVKSTSTESESTTINNNNLNKITYIKLLVSRYKDEKLDSNLTYIFNINYGVELEIPSEIK